MNELRDAISPYLRQHADQPVHWRCWNERTLAQARQEDKPIILSIGYSTCHWCHVMARESFEDAAVAEFMNQHFICIKIDREERPDLDRHFMRACEALTGDGGWPLHVFLTPGSAPFTQVPISLLMPMPNVPDGWTPCNSSLIIFTKTGAL